MRKVFHDHLGRRIEVCFPPKRIISLCPSITETLYDLNLGAEIVGRTHFCIHPREWVEGARKVGGTKQVDFEEINKLKPDLIITSKEENPKEMVERLAEKYPVYVTNVESFDDSLKMIDDLGEITNRLYEAEEMRLKIEKDFADLQKAGGGTVAYVIWKNPYMVVGKETFIHSMLEKCGWTNCFKDHPDRYPTVSIEELQKVAPDYLFLASEPFRFKESHIPEFKQMLPHTTILLVDGEIFSWYGSRLSLGVPYLNQLLVQIPSSSSSLKSSFRP